ncbi:hypothetical protein DXV75_07270 [Alteromonas aestuariivivens]|uniref:STAS/SEC14 domain-containing protein n=1 Tax=Alteromonas aestuariivivens TaxID=1938339 RepID=A0A3D8MAC3_9ALTE|nr:hypothetical protein DXV75_07270 [Alteromonas aestuariivivens]
MEAFGQDYRQAMTTLGAGKWADLITLIGESLFTPDAESSLRNRIVQIHQLGLTHVALNLTNSTVQLSSIMQSQRLYRGTSISLNTFSHQQEAMDWLKTQGFYTCDDETHQHQEAVKKLNSA